MDELRECPWCGKSNVQYIEPDNPYNPGMVICLRCVRQIRSHDAVAAWNALPRTSIEGDCIHCGRAVTNDDVDHWKSCSRHPANAEINRLRAALAPILAHADAPDTAPPLRISVRQARKMKETLNGR